MLSFQTAVLLDTLVVPGFLSGPASLSPPFGGFSADPGGTTVEEAGFQVQFVELGDLRLLSFSVVAVPEPSGARLGGGALAGLVLAAQVRRRSRNRPSTRSRASRVG